jgi:hypothetical protein
MVEEAEFCMIDSVGGIDENASTPHIQTHLPTSSFSKVESIMHLQVGSNVPNLDVLQLETIKAQAIAWRPHGRVSICWGFMLSMIITL